MVTLKQTKQIGEKLGVIFVEESSHNIKGITVQTLKKGILVEMEHGKRYAKFGINVTNNNLLFSAKIALAHLIEFPDYYERLEKLEQNAEKWWEGRRKPKIII
jgi:hypothetical protein